MFNLSKKKKQETPKKVLKHIEEMEKEIEKLSEKIAFLEEKSKLPVQKMEIVRYNPFSNVGGDQSFSVVFLDENDTGIIITSLYTQEGNRVYGKRIEEGKSKHSLSKEEEKVLNKAINGKQ